MTELTADKREQSQVLLSGIFELMECKAKLEFKDLADGALGVAVHVDGEFPGVVAGKKSPLLDSVQFWLNKAVNRPNTPRRWVNLGNGEFPAPREVQKEKPPAPVAAEKKPKKEERSRDTRRVDERTLSPAADARFSTAGKVLAEKAVKWGRVYGVLGLSADQRALMLAAADGVAGQKAKAEGDGHWRRFTVTADKLTPVSKKQVMPDYDDEEDE